MSHLEELIGTRLEGFETAPTRFFNGLLEDAMRTTDIGTTADHYAAWVDPCSRNVHGCGARSRRELKELLAPPTILS
jgi:hypothetical protein